MIILLDLNVTYVENTHDVHTIVKAQYDVAREVYRSWLTEMLRPHRVIMVTCRPDKFRTETLNRILMLENWKPELALFKPAYGPRMNAAQLKYRLVTELVFPKYGVVDKTDYFALESNHLTREMYARLGIPAMRHEKVEADPALLGHRPNLF